jgi:hypothetical protein
VCRSQWPRGLSRWSATARLLRLWVRIPPGAWMSVRCDCCAFSGRGLCVKLITRPEESYRLWCVVACDLGTSWMRRPWPQWGLLRQKRTNSNCVAVALMSAVTLQALAKYSVIWKAFWEFHLFKKYRNILRQNKKTRWVIPVNAECLKLQAGT